MSKRKDRRARKSKQKGWLVSPQQVNTWLEQAVNQILQQDYAGAVQTCRRILAYAPPGSRVRGEALEHLAAAYGMQRQFEEAYQALSEALEINPAQAYLWYNRALNGRFTMRLVQAVRDLEKAVELETDAAMRKKFSDLLVKTRQMAESERALRGPNFTLDELAEQEEWFNQGVRLMQQGQWQPAEQAFRRVIEMGECLPQPRGNLGLTLLMQKKYDEAEAAFKRALEIDPNYDLARENLAQLPATRESGEIPFFTIRDPFAKAKVGIIVQPVKDDD